MEPEGGGRHGLEEEAFERRRDRRRLLYGLGFMYRRLLGFTIPRRYINPRDGDDPAAEEEDDDDNSDHREDRNGEAPGDEEQSVEEEAVEDAEEEEAGESDEEEEESEAEAVDEEQQETDRRNGVVARFLELIRDSSRPPPLERLADLVREYGGGGDVLWHAWRQRVLLPRVVGPRVSDTVFADCCGFLSGDVLVNFARLLIAEYPDLPTKRGWHDWTLLHLAAGLGAPVELLRTLVELNREALGMGDGYLLRPIHLACQRRPLVFANVRLLEEENPETVETKDRRGRLPLAVLCENLTYSNPQHLDAIQLLLSKHPVALETRSRDWMMPIMAAMRTAFDEADHIPEAIDLLCRMIDRGGPISRTRTDGPGYVFTALQGAGRSCPHKDLFSSLLKALPNTLVVRDRHTMIPLGNALSNRWFMGGLPEAVEAVRFLIGRFPAALEARDERGTTPVMFAIWYTSVSRSDASGAALDVLQEVVCRSAESVRGTFRPFQSSPVYTALEVACSRSLGHGHGPPRTPFTRLVPAVMEAWPAALCVSLLGRLTDLPEEIAPAVRHKAGAMFLALMEVLLHDTTEGVVPGPVRERVRRLVGQAVGRLVDMDRVGSRIVASVLYRHVRDHDFHRLRSEILDDEPLQGFLRTNAPVQEMATGLYHMNEAGRLVGRTSEGSPEAVISPRRHARILEAAGGNVSCLFVHLREFAALLAGSGARAARPPVDGAAGVAE